MKAITAILLSLGMAGIMSGAEAPKVARDQTQPAGDTLDLGAMMQPLPDKGVFREKDHFAWCSSIIQDGGKYHLIYSRWPRKFGFYSWLTHSEVAHAVSDQPDGPYHYVETLIPNRGQHPWNQITAHNPKIEKFDGKYYLYFCSTHADFPEDELQAIARNNRARSKDWMILRNNQRTGVAVADRISGPWKVLPAPIVEPAGPIRNVTVNPAVCRRPDGKYLMIIKGDKPGSSQRNQAVALSNNPQGPFVLQPEPAIKDYDTEDVSVWYDHSRHRYYAIFHAHTFIGLITSADGIQWQKASHFTVTRKVISMASGTPRRPSSLERPFVYLENGKPRVLSMAAMEKGDTCILLAPLQQSDPVSYAEPKLGDADFPKPSPCARHNEKVAAVKTGKYDLVLIGDSITQCIGDSGGEWEPVKAVWAKHYAPRHALNLGYSGYRTENILWNLQNGELNFTDSPKVFRLLIGTNNLDDQHYPKIHTAEEVFAGTKAIVDLIRSKHPSSKIVIMRILPAGGAKDKTSFHRVYCRSDKALDALRRAGEMTAQLADGEHVFWVDLNHVFLKPDGAINSDLMPDLIHPNRAGHEAMAQALEPLLAKLMGDKPIIEQQPKSSVIPAAN